MGDWSILGRFLTEVQNHSTVIGKIWLTVLLIFRILLVALVGDAVYSDEQSKFTCNTLQPGCNNVCYDTFAPVSHLRFWVFQIVLVSTPSIFYVVYVLHKIAKDEKLETDRASQPIAERQAGGQRQGREDIEAGQGSQDGVCVDQVEVWKDPTQLSNQVLLTYIVHVVLRSIMEMTFLVGQYYLYGFEVPLHYRCETYPCPTRTDCFVSRATEKTIFLNFMFGISLGCFLLNMAELHYVGWVYIFRVLCSVCSACCRGERAGRHGRGDRGLLQLKHSLKGCLLLQPTQPLSQEKEVPGLHSHSPAISFETDSTMECMSRRSPEKKETARAKISALARLGCGKKSWL